MKNHESKLLQLNCDKAKILLNWSPRWGFSDTVKFVVGWYKSLYEGENMEDITNDNINTLDAE